MIHELTPDLCDPLLLAGTTLPSLYEAAGLEQGELKISYDPTLPRRPLRIRASEDALYDQAEGKRRVGELIGQIDDAFPPFRVAFLRARVDRPETQPWPLDLMTAVSGLQLFYLRAQACTDIIGERLQVAVSLSMPEDGAQAFAQVDCYLPGEGPAEPHESAALKDYTVAVEAFWKRLASTVIGHWCRDNGISELRLSAEILVDPRQAMAAIGQPIPEPVSGTVH